MKLPAKLIALGLGLGLLGAAPAIAQPGPDRHFDHHGPDHRGRGFDHRRHGFDHRGGYRRHCRIEHRHGRRFRRCY